MHDSSEERARARNRTTQASAGPDRILEVAYLWGDVVMDVQGVRPGTRVKMGTRRGAPLRLDDDVAGTAFELVTWNGTLSLLHAPPFARTLAGREGRELPISGAFTLAPVERARVDLGATHLVLRWVEGAQKSRTGLFDGADSEFTRTLSVAALAGLALLVCFWITPLHDELLSEDLFRTRNEWVKTTVRTDTPKPVRDAGSKPRDRVGKVGKPAAKRDEPARPRKAGPLVDPKQREDDKQKVLRLGLLPMLTRGGALDTVLIGSGIGSELNNALGNLKGGPQTSDAHGVGGYGSRGVGPGGGGVGLGIGDIGVKGGGPERGGYGDLDLGRQGKGETRIARGATLVQGSMSREVIARIVRQHESEIKYCYEQELSKAPSLAGKIAVAFIIGGTGDVSDATVSESTLNDPSLENCIALHIRRWRFPAPNGGGQVFVTYPWILRSGGADE
jgi:hypothetical protein